MKVMKLYFLRYVLFYAFVFTFTEDSMLIKGSCQDLQAAVGKVIAIITTCAVTLNVLSIDGDDKPSHCKIL